MNKRITKIIFAVLFSATLILTSIPSPTNAASFNELNEKCMFFKQKKSNTCTLASAAMMVKRAARLNNKSDWSTISETSMKSTAWGSNGLSNTFTYKGISVTAAGGLSNLNKVWNKSLSEKEKLYKNLLAKHPEGVVMYCKKSHNTSAKVHAILLTDYTNGKFYCSDPASGKKDGRIPLSDASVKMNNSFKYWYVTDYNAPAKTPTNTNVNIKLTSTPSTITEGNKFSLKGTISSGSKITSIKGYIYNSSNKLIQSTSEGGNKKSISIASAKVNTNLKFGNLKAGNYTLKIVAKNAAGKSAEYKKSFKVASKTSTTTKSTLNINLTQYPTNHTKGNTFGLRGTISSNYKLTEIKSYIINSNGTIVQSQTDKPNATSVDIRNLNINQNLKFATLAAGNYNLKIDAKDASGKTISITKTFKVTDTTKVTSTLNINLTQYPTNHTKGNTFGLRGTISSNFKITEVKGYIINSSGTIVQSQADKPNATNVDIRNLNVNQNLKFATLGIGKYTLKLEAKDASGKTISLSKSFSVVNVASTLKINLTQYPTSLTKGNTFGLRGSISSNYKITEVKGYIINSSGTTVQAQTDKPNTTSADIRPLNINQKLKFGTLAKGSYTLKIVAKDSSGKSVTVSKAFTVK